MGRGLTGFGSFLLTMEIHCVFRRKMQFIRIDWAVFGFGDRCCVRKPVMKKILTAVICVVLLLGLIAAAMYMNRKEEPIPDAGISRTAPEEKRTLTYQGTEYPLKKHLQTVLVIGTDSTEGYTELPEEERDYLSYSQADFLVLLVLDRDAGTVEAIQVNRDTMTDVPWLDVFGEYGGTERKQICLAFDYGDGGASSCRNTVMAVSNLLFDVPVDDYIQLPMVAIPQLNDLVGGVTVTIEDDMTVMDPAFVPGKTIKLTGPQAEKYVRARSSLADDTNLARMGRHRAYMDGFLKNADAALQADAEFALKAIEKLGNLLQSDMTANQLSELVNRLEKSEIGPVRYAAGELKLGSRHYEFYVDESSLWEIVRNACCE